MSNWEYKVISSGKGGFASPALMEKFLNDLGQEHWEILSFHTLPDNSLAFTGLARRTTQRDWTLEDAAAAAARAEADKLRAEFEAKFKAGSSAAAAAPEDPADTFLAEEKVGTDDGLRRLRDTSRDDDPDAPEEHETAPKDEWDKLAEEDELPTFFEALRPHMRRNQRGPGMSVGVDYLAKKWRLDESDIKGALVECGMQIPADENAKPVYVEFEGDLFWVNINRRGEVWINTREKPQPVFRVVAGKRLTDEESAAAMPQQGGNAQNESAAPHRDRERERERERDRERERRDDQAPAVVRAPAAAASESASAAQPERHHDQSPKNFLTRVRGLMRRNRRGHGWSGSFPFLTKALKTDEAGLLEQLALHGVVLPPEGSDQPVFHEDSEFVYWMNKNQRGEIWINARKGRKPENGRVDDDDARADEGGAANAAAGSENDQGASARPSDQYAAASDSAASTESPSNAPVEAVMPARFEEPSMPLSETAPGGSPDSTLAAVRLLLQPKKRGDGVAALVGTVAQQLGQTEDVLLGALAAAGLNVPEDSKAKPTFGEHGGEIFWLNRSTKGDLWLNAKASKHSGRKSRSRKSSDEEESVEGED